MLNRFKYFLPVLLLLTAGCRSNSERPAGEPVSDSSSNGIHVVDYATSDPRLEPTLRVGNMLEVRTTNGGPVVLRSQLEQQRKAAEQLHTNAEIIAPAESTSGEAKK